MKINTLTRLLLASTCLSLALFAKSELSFAHGYVETPPARGYQGALDKESLGWTQALALYGNVITNPQSLESTKGFPQFGPPDGRIASADGGSGQIGDYVLDNQTSSRWKKTSINTGSTTFNWVYTAPHKTTKWTYYMTKPGWDQDAPLTRDTFEPVGTIQHDGTTAANNLSHTIEIPENRLGYHVVLVVWDVDDTPNAFYNVMDVTVNNSVLPILPTQPTHLKATNITKNSLELSWNTQTTAAQYRVYRDDKPIATINGNTYVDSKLKADTSYSYSVEAVSANGLVSEKSQVLQAKTLAESTIEKPTAPTGLHSMGETTDTVSLMWNKATHSEGIKNYQIYRDNQLIAVTTMTMYKDAGLTADTTYTYFVKAVSQTGLISDNSLPLTVTTEEEQEVIVPGGDRLFKLGSLAQPELYAAQEIVFFNNKRYQTLVTHNNYGDSNWAPDSALTLFEEIK